MNFDIYINCHEKDKEILPFCIDSLKHIVDFKGDIFVCSNFEIVNKNLE